MGRGQGEGGWQGWSVHTEKDPLALLSRAWLGIWGSEGGSPACQCSDSLTPGKAALQNCPKGASLLRRGGEEWWPEQEECHRGEGAGKGASHLHPPGRERDENCRMHETLGPRPLRAGGETEARSMAADGPLARETQAGGFPFPLYLALELLSGANVLLGQQEEVEVTCGQVTDPL